MSVRIPSKVEKRLRDGVRKYKKYLKAAKDRDVNESDTVVIVQDFLDEVLGFDKYLEVTTEYSIRGTYCDLAVKVDGEVEFLIEAKAIGLVLKEEYIKQARDYAANAGIEWVVLTNGIVWQIYRLKFERPIDSHLVYSFDLLEAEPRNPEVLEQLFLLTREGIRKSAIDKFAHRKEALEPSLVGAVVLGDAVVSVVRRELRRISPDAKIDTEELQSILREEVIKREVVEGEQARAAKGRITRAANRNLRKAQRAKKAKKSPPAGPVSGSGPRDA